MLLGTPSFINHLNIRIMAKSALNVELYDNVLTEKKGDYTGKVSTPDFVIVSPKNLRQKVLLFSDVLPSALFGYKPPCSEVA